MDDLISRQAAIEIVQNMYPGMPRVPLLRKEWQKRYEPYIRVENAIRELPPVQPKQRWIPCSERLPEENADILVTFCDKDETRIVPVNYAMGTWMDCIFDIALNSVNVTAWMPLPEPYNRPFYER